MPYEEGQYSAEALAEHDEGGHKEETRSGCDKCQVVEAELEEAHLEGRHEGGLVPLCWVCDLPSLKEDHERMMELRAREAWDEERDRRARRV